MNTIPRVVNFLGATLILALALIGACALTDHSTPDVLVAVASGSLASLGTLLTRIPSTDGGDAATPPAPQP